MPVASHPILSHHFDSSEAAFAKIAEEVTALQESIRTLYAFRNTFTPTYRFPPEILSRIFSLVQQEVSKADSDTRFGVSNSKWILVSHVSQHWRSVALASPGLWSHITKWKQKGVVKEWLRRSKAAPLSINLARITSEDIEDIISVSLPRVRELSLDFGLEVWETLAQSLSSPAPLLESFSINNVHTISRHRKPSSLMISDALFSGAVPNLHQLQVVECSVDINSIMFANLTTLTLKDLLRRLPSQDVLAMLRGTSHLTSLTLSNVFHPNTSVAPDVDIVVLSSLSHLHITGHSFSQDLNILSHLSFPKDANLSFTSETQTRTEDGLTALLDFLHIQKAARLQNSPPTPSVSTIFCFASSPHFVNLSVATNCNPPPVVILEFMLQGQGDLTIKLSDRPEVAALFSFLPLQSIVTLVVNNAVDIGIWTNVFGSLPDLHYLCVCGESALTALDAIIDDFQANCPDACDKPNRREAGHRKTGISDGQSRHPAQDTKSVASSTKSSSWNPIFSSLGEIKLRGIKDFQGRDRHFVAALRARKAADKMIDTLTFDRCCDLDLEIVEQLVNAVGEVVFEEEEYHDGSDDSD